MRPHSFRVALSQHPEAVEELSDDTLLRYTRGNFPKAVQWLLRYPTLLRALADDAERVKEGAAQAGAARPTADCDEIARKGVAG